jgi:hypothetical protein
VGPASPLPAFLWPQASSAAARVPAAGARAGEVAAAGVVDLRRRSPTRPRARSTMATVRVAGGRPLSSGAPISSIPSSFFFPSRCSRSEAALVGLGRPAAHRAIGRSRRRCFGAEPYFLDRGTVPRKARGFFERRPVPVRSKPSRRLIRRKISRRGRLFWHRYWRGIVRKDAYAGQRTNDPSTLDRRHRIRCACCLSVTIDTH